LEDLRPDGEGVAAHREGPELGLFGQSTRHGREGGLAKVELLATTNDTCANDPDKNLG